MNDHAGTTRMRWPRFIGPLPQPNPIGWFRIGLAERSPRSTASPVPAFYSPNIVHYGGGVSKSIGGGGSFRLLNRMSAWPGYQNFRSLRGEYSRLSAHTASTPIPLARVRKKGASSRRRFYSKQR